MIRNRLMTFASIVTVSACTLVLAVSYFLLVNLDQVIDTVESEFVVVAFIYDDVPEANIEELQNRILSLNYVDGISFTSFEEAFETAAVGFGMADFLVGIYPGSGVFPRSFTIEVRTFEEQENIVNIVSNMAEIESARHDQEGLDLILGITSGIRLVSIIVILFLGLISTIIIVNTIKITVSARKSEISIMKYVGATNSFIRWPFLVEGILIGFLGAILALIISYFIYTAALTNIITNFYQITAILELREVVDVFIVLAPIAIAMGIFIGFIGSASSIRKYLKV